MNRNKFCAACACVLCALLAFCAPALASLADRSFSEDMKQFGERVGEAMKRFGDEVVSFSEDPKAYIENSESIQQLESALDQAKADLSEHWPVLKSSVKGAVEAVLDSDLSWEEKKEQLKQYGVLAIPFLAEVDFEQMGDDAKAAMAALKDFLSMEDDAEVKAWIDQNKQRLQELREYLER